MVPCLFLAELGEEGEGGGVSDKKLVVGLVVPAGAAGASVAIDPQIAKNFKNPKTVRTTAIDHRELLVKYMTVIISEEGIDFIADWRFRDLVEMTEAEFNELRRISEEANSRLI